MRGTIAALAIVGVVTVTGCTAAESPSEPAGGAAGASTSVPSTSSDPSASSDVERAVVDPDAPEPTCEGREIDVSDREAAEQFGTQKVKDAYCLVVEMLNVTELENLLVDRDDLTPSDFTSVNKYLTPKVRRFIKKRVRITLAQPDNDKARADVSAFYSFAGVGDSGYRVPEDGYVVRSRTISGPDYEYVVKNTTGEDALAVDVTSTIKLNARKTSNDRRLVATTTKDLTFYMLPGGDADMSWLIDEYAADYGDGTSYGPE